MAGFPADAECGNAAQFGLAVLSDVVFNAAGEQHQPYSQYKQFAVFAEYAGAFKQVGHIAQVVARAPTHYPDPTTTAHGSTQMPTLPNGP